MKKPYRSLDLKVSVTEESLLGLDKISVERLYSELTREKPVIFDSADDARSVVMPILQRAIRVINEPCFDDRVPFNFPFLVAKKVKKGTKKHALITVLSREGGSTVAECMVYCNMNYTECVKAIRYLHRTGGFGLREGPDKRIELLTK